MRRLADHPWLAGAVVPAAIAVVAWRSGGELIGIILVAAVASVATAVQFARRGRGSTAQNLWQVNLATFGALTMAGLLLVALLSFVFAGYCDDGCEPARSRVPGLLLSAGAALAAIGVAVALRRVWRWMERQRTAQPRRRWLLILPVVLAWLIVGVTSLPADVLLREPEPQGHKVRVAAEACVDVSPGLLPCRSVARLDAAANGGDVLIVWKNATAVRGVLRHAGRNEAPITIAAVPRPGGEDGDALTAAPAHGGGFAVVWSEDANQGQIRTARVAADGTPTAPVPLGFALGAYPTVKLVRMAGGYLLFAGDTPDPRHSGPTRLVALPLDRAMRPRGTWRVVLREIPRHGSLLAAAALDATTAAVTYRPDNEPPATVSVDAQGEPVAGATEGTVAVPAGIGRGSVTPVPEPPARVRTAAAEGAQFPARLDAMAGEGRGLRTLWWSRTKGLRRNGYVGDDQLWVGRPGIDGAAWLAAVKLRQAQLVVSSAGAWVVGVELGEEGAGGGHAADVVAIRAP